MDELLSDSMKAYYDECVDEYELIYQGLGSAQVKHPEFYKREARIIGTILADRIHGNVLDFACGTGYWIQFYLQNCRALTLLDQSENMLGLASKKVGSSIPLQLMAADIYKAELPARSYGSILAGFIFSHIIPERELPVLTNLLRSLEKDGCLIVVDSAWSKYRKEILRNRQGTQMRTLSNGKTFNIYKKYYEKDDLQALGRRARCHSEVLHDGDVFIAAQFKHG